MALTAAAATALSAGIAAAAGGASTGIQAGRGKKGREQAQAMFDAQMSFAREQWDYQKYASENAYQMATADAEKAGLSPLAVLDAGVGSATSASPVSQPSAPDYASFSPDMNTMADGFRAASDAILRGFEETGRNERNKDDNQNTLDAINEQYRVDAEMAAQQNNYQMSTLFETLAAQEYSDDRKVVMTQNQSIRDAFSDLTAGIFDNYAEVDTPEQLAEMKKIFADYHRNDLEQFSKLTDIASGSSMDSSSSSTSGGLSLGANKSTGFAGASAGIGGNVGLNGSRSSGETSAESNSYNRTKNNAVELGQRLNDGPPYPLLKMSRHYSK